MMFCCRFTIFVFVFYILVSSNSKYSIVSGYFFKSNVVVKSWQCYRFFFFTAKNSMGSTRRFFPVSFRKRPIF